MQQDGDTSFEGLDGRDSITLDGGHKEEMGLGEEMLEIVIGNEVVKVDAVANAQIVRHLLERWDHGAFAGQVEPPIDTGGEGSWVALKLGETAEDPIDAFAGFDTADGEDSELFFDETHAGREC